MKSRDTLIRLKRFQVEEKRRRVRQIEMMVAEFTRMAADLDREIANEEKRAGISDPQHFAYPTYARAAITRRDNLKSSIGELAIQIEEAKAAQADRAGRAAEIRVAGRPREGRGPGSRGRRAGLSRSDRRKRSRLADRRGVLSRSTKRAPRDGESRQRQCPDFCAVTDGFELAPAPLRPQASQFPARIAALLRCDGRERCSRRRRGQFRWGAKQWRTITAWRRPMTTWTWIMPAHEATYVQFLPRCNW